MNNAVTITNEYLRNTVPPKVYNECVHDMKLTARIHFIATNHVSYLA